ncbi:MAG: CRISPR-associated endonuclease Cas1 [Akkermansiaceae bacterium]|nr:CRISPR-associated endonuclease Cas1 [Akkermansiaceae bacterium]
MNPDLPPMPVRRLHNYLYCPRLFYLQWVEDLFVENSDTASGAAVHKRVDEPSHLREQDLEMSERAALRSVAVHSEALGLTGIVDLIEDTGNGRQLLEYKRGAPRRDEDGNLVAKDNDAAQLASYALLLREEGIEIARASVYYAAEKKRVAVPLTEALFENTLQTLREARAVAESGVCPPPLRNDPRCLHCSAYSVCLPNESTYWAGLLTDAPKDKEPPRPPIDDGEILVVQNPRAYVGRRGGEMTVALEGEILTKHPLEQVQAVYIFGAVQMSTQAVQGCLERSIPIAYFSPAGRFLGMTSGLPTSGTDARQGQYRLFGEPGLRAKLAASILSAKIHNQRVLLMRNGDAPKVVLDLMASLRDQAGSGDYTLDSLRGIEGSAAALYFEHFGTMLKGTAFENFDFNGRNRRPPKDPVNALLSQGYSILAKELTGMCHAVGLDPFLGFLHQPRYGRPALALDLMEEFRPLLADSVAISLLNRRELDVGDFTRTTRGTFMGDEARKQFWRAWFRRMDTEVSHPQFGYKMSYRRMLDVQTRQFWRFCRGEATEYHAFTTR